jgi:hypothetical protein
LCAERLLDCRGHPLCCGEQWHIEVGRQVPQRVDMASRDEQRMPLEHGPNVEERHDVSGVENDIGRLSPAAMEQNTQPLIGGS